MVRNFHYIACSPFTSNLLFVTLMNICVNKDKRTKFSHSHKEDYYRYNSNLKQCISSMKRHFTYLLTVHCCRLNRSYDKRWNSDKTLWITLEAYIHSATQCVKWLICIILFFMVFSTSVSFLYQKNFNFSWSSNSKRVTYQDKYNNVYNLCS